MSAARRGGSGGRSRSGGRSSRTRGSEAAGTVQGSRPRSVSRSSLRRRSRADQTVTSSADNAGHSLLDLINSST